LVRICIRPKDSDHFGFGSRTLTTTMPILQDSLLNVIMLHVPPAVFLCLFSSGHILVLSQQAWKTFDQDEKRLSNYSPSMGKEESVVEQFPRMDVVCFQVIPFFLS